MILNNADNVMYGDKEVSRLYYGNYLVWQRNKIDYEWLVTPSTTYTSDWCVCGLNNPNKRNTVILPPTITAIVSPSTVAETKVVSEISRLSGFDDVEHLIIKANLKRINAWSFENNTTLKVLEIQGSCEDIRVAAFKNSSLRNVSLYGNIKEIKDSCFAYCSQLETVLLSEQLEIIDTNVFYKCTSLKYIHIPSSVTSIGDYAFSDCESLTSINISNGLNNIGGYTFANCINLTSINIPDSVTSIGEGAFENCTSLASINIPDSVTSINYRAFSGCRNLTSINISEGVANINQDVFLDCTNLENINIPDSVTSIGSGAFYGTKLLESQTGVKYADTWVVACDRDVTTVEIKDGTRGIGDRTFSYCTSLTSVDILDSVTNIGQYAFNRCSNLAHIYYTGTEEQWNAITKGIRWNYNMGSNVTGGTQIHYNYVPE